MIIALAVIKCLLLTIIFELAGALILRVKNKKDLLNIVLVNIVTNPLVTTIPLYINLEYGIFLRRIVLLILEIYALLFEGYIYHKFLNYKKINGFLLSLILNLISYGMGVIIYGF